MSETTLPVTVSKFRSDIPAFANQATYPTPMVLNFLTVASQKLDINRWGEMQTLGIEWFTAHFLTLYAQDMAVAARGGVPGQVNGPVSSKSAGPVSISYDTNASLEDNGGFWNLTTYGKMFLRYAKMAGMGGVQISGGAPFPGNWFPGTGLQGPFPGDGSEGPWFG